MNKKWQGKYIGYFQANTNTYAPLPILKEKYDSTKTKNYNSIISNLFYFIDKSKITCTNCNAITYNFQIQKILQSYLLLLEVMLKFLILV